MAKPQLMVATVNVRKSDINTHAQKHVELHMHLVLRSSNARDATIKRNIVP